jgi:hypothetical protein
VAAHQAHDVRVREHLGGRAPDDLGHGAKPSLRAVDTFC